VKGVSAEVAKRIIRHLGVREQDDDE